MATCNALNFNSYLKSEREWWKFECIMADNKQMNKERKTAFHYTMQVLWRNCFVMENGRYLCDKHSYTDIRQKTNAMCMEILLWMERWIGHHGNKSSFFLFHKLSLVVQENNGVLLHKEGSQQGRRWNELYRQFLFTTYYVTQIPYRSKLPA